MKLIFLEKEGFVPTESYIKYIAQQMGLSSTQLRYVAGSDYNNPATLKKTIEPQDVIVVFKENNRGCHCYTDIKEVLKLIENCDNAWEVLANKDLAPNA